MADALGIKPSPTGAMPLPSTIPASPADQANIKSTAQQLLTERQGEKQQLTAAEQQIKPMPQPPTEAELAIHPKQASMFFPLMMALGALGGLNTRAPMTAAMNNMSAVMKGQMEGEQTLTKQHQDRLWKNYDAAMQAHENSIKDFKVALDKYNSTGDPTEMRLAVLAKTGDTKLANQVSSNPHDANQYVETLDKIAAGLEKQSKDLRFKYDKEAKDIKDKAATRGQKTADEHDREISKLTDDMHNTVNATEKAAIEDRIKELRQKRNAGMSGDTKPTAVSTGHKQLPANASSEWKKVGIHTDAKGNRIEVFADGTYQEL